MKPQTLNTVNVGSRNTPPSAPLRGRSLSVARGSWVVIAALVFVLFAFAVPAELEYLQIPCAECDGPRLSLEGTQRLEKLGLSLDFYATYTLALEISFAVATFAVALLIFWRRSDDGTALLGALTLLMLGITFPNATAALAESYPAWELPVALAGFLGPMSFTLFFFVFPNGRFVPSWTRWMSVALVALMAPTYFFPESSVSVGAWPPLLQLVFYLIWLGGLVAAQLYRYRRVSSSSERQQTKWVVFGFAAAITGFLVSISVYPFLSQPGPLAYLIGNTAIYLSMLMIPLSIGVAILRHRLFDIDLIINRALVYGALTASVVGIYVLVVGGLGALLQARGSLLLSLLATGLVAVLFAPLRNRLQRGVNRMMYGERDDPYAVLSRLGQRLGATLKPHAVLPAVAETVAHALKLPHVAIELKQGDRYETTAEYGRPEGEPLRLPLVYGSETVGQLVLSPRSPGESFGPTDRRLLDDLARQAGVAAHAVRLTDDLQRSRERLVATREEERRRIRRNLHDGLGPALSSAMLKLGAARRLLPPGSHADDLIVEVRDDMRATVADVRGLVYDLRPPALDQLGLMLAIRDYAEQYVSDSEAGMRVTVEPPESDSLPPLPAAVEVAAYNIAREAITNTARHARAPSCRVHLALQDGPEQVELRLEIIDDGVGLPDESHLGVGLSSMRERAEELGGKFSVESTPGEGTRVVARLPVRKE